MNSNVHLDEYIDFQKYFLVLKRRWKPALGIFSSIVGLSLVGALSLAKIYQAEAKLLIKADQSATLTGLENGSGEIKGLTTDSNPLSTEAEVVLSRPIIKSLITELDLRDDDGVLLKYKAVADGFKAKPITGTDILEIKYNHEDPELAALVVNKVVELYIKDHTFNNRSETASAKDFIDKQLPEVEARVQKAEANLRDFKNKNRIASLSEETTANVDSLSNVGDRINEVEAQLENVNARYRRLQAQLNISWQEASAVSALSQSLSVQSTLEQLQNVKLNLARRQNFLSDNTPQIVALKQEEADLTALLDSQISKTIGNQHQGIAKKINILSLGELKQGQIAAFSELYLQKEGLEEQLVSLRRTYESHKQKSDGLPRLQEQERELARRVEAAQSTYQTLLAKLQETRITEQQNIGNVRVVSEADIPDKAIAPNKKIIVGGAIVIGAFLSLAGAFFLDIRDKTIKNTDEIKKLLPYLFSGVIPDFNKITPQKQSFLEPSETLTTNSTNGLAEVASTHISSIPIKEAYHNIQINLQLLDSSLENKVIVVTSSVSGEGKSSVSANLAIAQAQCDKKVLLIDADLRRPNQHNLWEVPNYSGLTEILQQNMEWFDYMHHVMPNLDLITSGSRPKNPISLLNSPYMRDFIASAARRYDHIIIDTPPLVGLADSRILAKLADGLLFVVRPKTANYSSVLAAKELLESQDFNLLGILANGVALDHEPYGHEYYYADKKYLEAAG